MREQIKVTARATATSRRTGKNFAFITGVWRPECLVESTALTMRERRKAAASPERALQAKQGTAGGGLMHTLLPFQQD
jgi:hypothetical protein